jgi:hypothetical protein
MPPRPELTDPSRALLVLASDVRGRVTLADAADATKSVELSIVSELVEDSRRWREDGRVDTCLVMLTVQQGSEAISTVILRAESARLWLRNASRLLDGYED